MVKPTIDRIRVDKTNSGKILYLNQEGVDPHKQCQVCLEFKKTSAHHIIPVRIGSKSLLARIRMRVCKDCNKKLHPENEIFEESVFLKKKEKVIRKLGRQLRKLKKKEYFPFLEKLKQRYKSLQDSADKIPNETKDKTKIHPALKMIHGRLKENKYIQKLYRDEFILK